MNAKLISETSILLCISFFLITRGVTAWVILVMHVLYTNKGVGSSVGLGLG